MSWRAWHIFLADPILTDQFLLDVVQPAVSALQQTGALSNWFFIRYWENGPHVRLRLHGVSDQDFLALGQRLASAAAAAVTNAQSVPDHYPPSLRFDGWHADPSALPWFEQGAVHEIMYEPEYRRYGGPDGLTLSEVMFSISSKTALKTLAATKSSWPQREAVALRLTCASIMALGLNETETIDFLNKMASAWRGFAPDPAAVEALAKADYEPVAAGFGRLWTQLKEGSPSSHGWPPLVRSYGQHISTIRQGLVDLAAQGKLISPLTGIATRDANELAAALKSIMLSYIHMMNNRLGLSPIHEYRFAQMLAWAAQDEIVSATA